MRLVLLTLAFILPMSSLAQCLKDYRVNQRWQAHNLNSQQLSTLQQFAQDERPGEGWHYLADLGDPYAALAANVIDPKSNSSGAFFHNYIYRHWENTVGAEITELNFKSFANQHFRQYVNVLSTGTWPDADQILNSYLNAARAHGLPELIVFDAAWTASDFSNFVSWQTLNQLPSGRRILQSRICLPISRREANRSLNRDFWGPTPTSSRLPASRPN